MRLGHLDTLRPICPLCRVLHGREAPVKLSASLREEAEHVVEGLLQCTSPECGCEYPILDGVPLLVPDVRSYLADNAGALSERDDLCEELEGILGEAAGPGSASDAIRLTASSYAWDHYGDLDPEEPGGPSVRGLEVRPGGVVRLLEHGLADLEARPTGPLLDAGCAVGRATFELARHGPELVLGADLHFPALRLAARALRTGVVRYPRRRAGMVYERREFPVSFEGADRVDFWACDATALPFQAATFAGATALNLLDSVASPLDLLRSLARVLVAGGRALLTTPYDWSGAVTPPAAWLGGHSVRAPQRGEGDAVLRALLTPGAHPVSIEGLVLASETADVPWQVRLHDRSAASYRVHLVTAVAG